MPSPKGTCSFSLAYPGLTSWANLCRRSAAELVRFSRPLYVFQIDAFFRHFVQRRKFAQALDGFDDAIGDVVNLGFGIKTTDAEADGTVRQIVSGAESLQYIRWLQASQRCMLNRWKLRCR